MNMSPKSTSRSPFRTLLRISPVAAAASSLLLGPLVAQAQTLDTVVVTGIRKSIESSIAIKKNTDSIVEAITAEDLGKLPDASIAESLARLPGLAGQRVNGTTQEISIRGLAPRYAVTLLNGREIVSSGPGRSVEFDQFPGELLAGATVYKTPDAALGAQGLSGTVNLKTVRPLDFAGRQANLNARYEKNSHGEQIPGLAADGKRISASYVDQFAGKTLGVAIGFAHLDSPEQQQHYANWWWANTANWGAPLKGVATDAVALQEFEATAWSTNQTRNGLMAVVEYKPSKEFRSTVDLYYSKFTKKFVGREFQASMHTWNDNITYKNTVYENWEGEKVLVGGAIDNIGARLLSRRNKRDDDIKAVGWNNELKVGDWTAVADLSYSKYVRDETTAEAYGKPKPGVTSGFSSFQINRTEFAHFVPSIDWADPTKVQLGQEWGQMGSTRYFDINDSVKSARLSVNRSLDWGPITKVEAGVNFTDRTKDYKSTKDAWDLKSGATSAPIPSGVLGAPATLGFGSIPSVANFDVQDLFNTGLFSLRADDLSAAPNRQWGVDEKVTTAFLKFNLDFKLGDVPVRGNFGTQMVKADQTGRGLAWMGSSVGTKPVTGGTSYSDVLPSLNLVGELTSDTVLRFGLAKVLARPNMEDMRAGVNSISRDKTGLGLWSANGGNPKLEPWRGDSVDLAIEKYIGKRSYFSIATFYKELKSSIYSQSIDWDFTGYPDPLNGTPPIITTKGKLTTPANGEGGWVRGTEISAALDGGRLAPELEGFGIIGSASYTKSSIHHGNNPKNPLEGLSGTVTSLVVYYEKNGFQARVGQRFRSRYLAAGRNVWGDTSYNTIEPERIVDAQIGYSWESGPLKGLSILAQINNATNTPYKTMMSAEAGKVSDPNYLSVFEKYGKQYLLGVNYKL